MKLICTGGAVQEGYQGKAFGTLETRLDLEFEPKGCFRRYQYAAAIKEARRNGQLFLTKIV